MISQFLIYDTSVSIIQMSEHSFLGCSHPDAVFTSASLFFRSIELYKKTLNQPTREIRTLALALLGHHFPHPTLFIL